MQIDVEKLQSPCLSTDTSSQFHLDNNIRTGSKSQTDPAVYCLLPL